MTVMGEAFRLLGDLLASHAVPEIPEDVHGGVSYFSYFGGDGVKGKADVEDLAPVSVVRLVRTHGEEELGDFPAQARR